MMSFSGERTDLQGWDRETYLLEYFRMGAGYVVKRHGFGRTLINDHDELKDLALDALLRLADSFPEWCSSNGREPSGRLFWALLKTGIDQTVQKELDKIRLRRYLSVDERFGDDGEGDGYQHPLLTAHELDRYRQQSLLHRQLCDCIAVLPFRWKLQLALRFHEELSLKDISLITGQTVKAQIKMTNLAVGHVHAFAIAQTVDTPPQLEHVRTQPWTAPDTVHAWIEKHTPYEDVHAFLGQVQRNYADDVSYIADILWRSHSADGARGPAYGARGDLHYRNAA